MVLYLKIGKSLTNCAKFWWSLRVSSPSSLGVTSIRL